jgi:hydrophobe/amphiphile efflux-1 (HAE1) family protein
MLPRVSLRNPVAVLMISLATIIIGVTSVQRLPVDLFPQLTVPVIVVGTMYPGATPEVVEQTVTYPVERAVAQASNLWYIESLSRFGFSSVTIWFRWGANVDAAQLEVSELVKGVTETLPAGTWPPIVVRFDISKLPLATITMEGTVQDERTLYELGVNTIGPQLAGLPGIASSRALGGRVREIVVELNPDLMREKGISILDVERAVRSNHLVAPSGNLRVGSLDYNVFTNSMFRTPRDMNDIVVKAVGQVPIHIKDLGEVRDGAQIRLKAAHVNGKRSVFIDVFKTPGANTVEAVRALRAQLPKLEGLPPDIKLDLTFDQAVYIENALTSLEHEAIMAGGLALLVILIFLGSVRATIIVSAALPLSMAASCIMLYIFNHSLNLFTLGGLVLTIGILVDDSIVVLENIHRHLENGESPLEASLRGAQQVTGPIRAATIGIVIIFLPLTFLSGISKYLFSPLAFAAVSAIIASHFLSLSVVPVFARAVLKSVHPGAVARGAMGRLSAWLRAGFERIDRAYEAALMAVLRHRVWMLLGSLAVLGASLLLVPHLGTEFFPESDESQFTIRVRAPVGTRVEETEKIVTSMEKVIADTIPKSHMRTLLANLGTTSGVGGSLVPANTGPHSAVLRIELVKPDKRDKTTTQYQDILREKLQALFPGIRIALKPGGIVADVLTFGTLAPIDVEIRGFDLEAMRKLQDQIIAIMKDTEGLRDVFVNREYDYPQFNVRVDRVQAAVLGVDIAEVAAAMRASLYGNYSRPPIYFDPDTGNPYFVITRLAYRHRHRIEDLGEIHLTKKDQPIFVRNVAEIERSSGPPQIDRRAQQRVIDVLANPVGRDLGSISAELDGKLQKLKIPPGISVKLRGQTEEQRETFKSLVFASILALVLVYMTLAAQYKSLMQPLVTLLTEPFGFSGVFIMFYLTDTAISTTAFMGIIMMVGITVRAGVMLIDQANELRREGLPLMEATIRASRGRLRAILMTSLAAAFGLVPMALAIGAGSEANAPLARAVIGGLVVGTALTLFFVPTLYTLTEERWGKSREIPAEDRRLLYD